MGNLAAALNGVKQPSGMAKVAPEAENRRWLAGRDPELGTPGQTAVPRVLAMGCSGSERKSFRWPRDYRRTTSSGPGR